MRIGADDQLPRQRIALGHQRVRDANASGVAFIAGFERLQVAVVREAVLVDESAVCARELLHAADEALAQMRRAAMHVRQVVFEGDDGLGFVQRQFVAEGIAQHVRGHAGVVLVDKAQIGAHEAAFAGDERGPERVTVDDLFKQGQRAGGRFDRLSANGPRFSRNGLPFSRNGLPFILSLSKDPAVPQQPTRTHDCRRQRIASLQQLIERDRLATLDALHQREIRARQQPDVIRVLPVDPLEALGDHQAHAGRALGDHAVLARTALAVALAGDDDVNAGVAQRIAPDRHLAAGLETGVRVAAERGVEVHHHR